MIKKCVIIKKNSKIFSTSDIDRNVEVPTTVPQDLRYSGNRSGRPRLFRRESSERGPRLVRRILQLFKYQDEP